MKSAILKYVLGVSVSCAFAISYSNPSKAFPVLTDTLAVKSSTPSLITDVRIYGRGYGHGGRYYGYGRGYGGAAAAGIIGGIAAGAIVGSIAANNGYYYGPGPYAYSPGPYGAYAYDPGPYDQGPAYYGGTHYYYTSPAYAPYKHWTEF
ncbi:MAG TPA: hypothetical protein VHQ86_06275 [Candidatus Saccharimonadia bacterium]|nr:hypothetical protein [Candidatus Saccharimonadia bacterium]